MKQNNVAILGATGSIGSSTLNVMQQYPDRFRAWALTANSDVEKLVHLAEIHHPDVVVIADKSHYAELKRRLAEKKLTSVRALAGAEALCAVAADSAVDTVVQAVVGAAGVSPSFAAGRAGRRLLIANKESLVCGGDVLTDVIRQSGTKLLPVDSEHNAIFQCLEGVSETEREHTRLMLTCSGGPFHAHPEVDLKTVTPEQALAHPTWKMGRKISIDSATLMNKGLEVIEAHHLFNVPGDRIDVVIHPQSVIHSMVQMRDGAVIAQLASPDMRLAIGYCFGYPERLPCEVKPLNFAAMKALTFTEPDMKRFPQLAFAYEALRVGGSASIVLNAANEIGVEAFLAGAIGFTDIARLCETMLTREVRAMPGDETGILEADREIRIKSRELIQKGL